MSSSISDRHTQLKGSFYILLSSFFFGTYGFWAKLMGNSLDNLFQVWTRSLLILLIIVPIAVVTKQIKPVRAKDVKWIMFYTMAGALTLAPLYYAFNTIGIGSATLLFYASLTIVSYVAGAISFGEKMTYVKMTSLVLALVGLGFIFNLSLSQNMWLAALAAIISGSAGGIEVTYTKKVSDHYSPLQLSIFLWLVIFISHIVLSLVLGERWLAVSFTIPWLAVVGYSIASLGAFFLVVLGYKYSEPSVAGIVGLLEIIFAMMFGLLFFHEALSLPIVLGCVLIIVAAALPNLKQLSS